MRQPLRREPSLWTEQMKVRTMLVIAKGDMEANTVSVRAKTISAPSHAPEQLPTLSSDKERRA
jgi:hypothetical protein